MVSLEEGSAVIAKIIDLGLAKGATEAGSQTAISTPGAFAGTPEFASPEQFAGVGVGYPFGSLLVGRDALEDGDRPYAIQGSVAEVMYRHQHAPLPLEQLEAVPQPVVALVEVLLEKDPERRFQTPAEFLEQMPTIAGAIEEGRTLTCQSLRQMPAKDAYAQTRKAPRRRGPEKISVARLPITGSDLTRKFARCDLVKN